MKKLSKIILVTISLIILFTAVITASFYFYPTKNAATTISPASQLLGQTEYGAVYKEGPYGNTSSPVKIAFIVGVHPLEPYAHQAMMESVKNHDKSLQYCYYIYRVNVTRDFSDYETGRMNGQLLANKFAVPDITGQKFQLAVDVHSNLGNWQERRFVFSPVDDSKTKSIALNLTSKISWLKYYIPPDPTSPQYVTIPLIQAGVPAIVYEAYTYDSYETKRNYADELLVTVDSLKYN